jgi:hypothetical protein
MRRSISLSGGALDLAPSRKNRERCIVKDHQRKRHHNWLIVGIAAGAIGLLMMFTFRSIPMAFGAGVAMTVAIIVLKHLALAVVIGAPMLAFPRSIKTTLRAYCPWAPRDR